MMAFDTMVKDLIPIVACLTRVFEGYNAKYVTAGTW